MTKVTAILLLVFFTVDAGFGQDRDLADERILRFKVEDWLIKKYVKGWSGVEHIGAISGQKFGKPIWKSVGVVSYRIKKDDAKKLKEKLPGLLSAGTTIEAIERIEVNHTPLMMIPVREELAKAGNCISSKTGKRIKAKVFRNKQRYIVFANYTLVGSFGPKPIISGSLKTSSKRLYTVDVYSNAFCEEGELLVGEMDDKNRYTPYVTLKKYSDAGDSSKPTPEFGKMTLEKVD